MINPNTQTEIKTIADAQVRQTEDASLQDDSYSFDEDNTDNEEYHDVDDADLVDDMQ